MERTLLINKEKDDDDDGSDDGDVSKAVTSNQNGSVKKPAKKKLIGLFFGVFFIFVSTMASVSIESLKEDEEAVRMAGIVAAMTAWWLSEAVPLAVTALSPVFLFPLAGIMPASEISRAYWNDTLSLLVASSFLAVALEKWRLDRRIALSILLKAGKSPELLMLGFMSTSAVLSMFMSNTATCLIVSPMIVNAVRKLMRSCRNEEETDVVKRYGCGLMLASMVSCTIGGTGTLTGSGSQLIFTGQLETIFPESPVVTYFQWFSLCFPMLVVYELLLWRFMIFRYLPYKKENRLALQSDQDEIKREYENLGPMTWAEKFISTIFIILILLWFTRDPGFSDGWSVIFPWSDYITDSTSGLLASFILFAISNLYTGEVIIDKSDFMKVSWDMLLLLGGGFAIAEGFDASGLSQIISDWLAETDSLSSFLISFLISLTMLFLTAVMSNTAATSLLVPIAAQVAVTTRTNPILLMLPTTLTSAYTAHMFPFSTPINAVAYETNLISLKEMMVNGVMLNIFGLFYALAGVFTLGLPVYDIDVNKFPDWAETDSSLSIN